MNAPGPGVPSPLRFDSIVLAGGRSSRLDGTPKAGLSWAGSTLLQHTVETVRPHGRVVVVGPEDIGLPADVLRTREDPPYSGPASGTEAGVVVLSELPGQAPWTAVLACDMPRVGCAVPTLASAARSLAAGVDGVIAQAADGHRENLAVFVRTPRLNGALDGLTTTDMSMRRLWSRLRLAPVPVPEGSTADVDTWDDVDRFDLH